MKDKNGVEVGVGDEVRCRIGDRLVEGRIMEFSPSGRFASVDYGEGHRGSFPSSEIELVQAAAQKER